MCELMREQLPEATIVIGGHVCSVPEIDRIPGVAGIFFIVGGIFLLVKKSGN